MEVILREDIDNLGHRGQVVNVAPGYARNFLLPRKLAVPATASNIAIIEQERQAHLRREAKAAGDASELAKLMAGVVVTIRQKAGENDQLFGSVTAQDIATPATAAKSSWMTPSNNWANTKSRSASTARSPPRSPFVSRKKNSWFAMSSYFDLSGQVAVVTGAATGIGEAISRRLANAGATVGIADIDASGAEAVANSLGAPHFALPIDITSGDSVRDAIASVIARFNRLDVWVNNAGIGGKAAPITEQTDEDWRHIIAINLTGVFYCCRAVIPYMKERGYGRIVNLASIAGKEGNPNMTGYSATKAGVIALTKSVAKEVATHGICVNAVSPAVIRTKILEQLTEQQVAYMTARIPMGRTGTPEEIAAVVHFLASPDCSFVTGQCYDASGGRATY